MSRCDLPVPESPIRHSGAPEATQPPVARALMVAGLMVDFAANPTINPATINALATGGWVASGAPLCLIGDSGTGKSHLLIGLGTAAAEAGHRVRYVRSEERPVGR